MTRPAVQQTLFGFTRQFWILVFGTLINSTGSALVFPFIALYIGRTFGVTEAETGLVFTFHAAVALFSGAAGGALNDRFGRKTVMVIGLTAAIVFSILMAIAQSFVMILAAILVTGLFAPIFGPAANAMVADMLPEEQRQRGYGMVRVAANLGVVIGPMLGGLLADVEGGFFWLFIGDAITSGLFALLIALFIKETRPAITPGQSAKKSRSWLSNLNVFSGYGQVIRDTPFVLFSLTYLASTLVYSQMNTNLVLYLDKEFAITAQQYSYLIALNAFMVVLSSSHSRRIWNALTTSSCWHLGRCATGSDLGCTALWGRCGGSRWRWPSSRSEKCRSSRLLRRWWPNWHRRICAGATWASTA
jgi:MFS family permease